MKTITKYTLSFAGILLLSGAAMAGQIVQVNATGQGGPVSFVKPDAPSPSYQTTTIGFYRHDRGIANAPDSGRRERKPVFGHTGMLGNGRSVTYWEGR